MVRAIGPASRIVSTEETPAPNLFSASRSSGAGVQEKSAG